MNKVEIKKVKVVYGDEEEGTVEVLNKLKAEQKLLELFETKEIEKIEISYKKRESACTADSNI